MTTVSASDLDRILSQAVSKVAVVFAPIVDEIHAALKNQANSSCGEFRLVTVSYNRLPPVKLLIDDILANGYEFHSDRAAFSRDRRRDYDLTINGYLVLRLPQDEVVEDVELAVEKIRDVVRFRRTSTLPRSENPQ